MRKFSVAALSSVLFLSAPAVAQQPAVTAPAPPPLRMAFVDLQRVAAESGEGKVASGKVQALTQKKTAELADKTKQLEADQQKLQQGGAVLNEATRAQLQKEVDRLTVEIDRFQQDAQQEVQEMQQQLQTEFTGKLRPILDVMVKELGVGLLFNATDAGAIYIDPSLDITPEVIKRFDAMAAAPKGAVAAPKPTTPPAAAAPRPPAATPAPAGRGAAPAPAPAAPKP
jgi:outer membrane protein